MINSKNPVLLVKIIACFVIWTVFLTHPARAEEASVEISADAIMQKSYAVYSGDDSLSRITFTFQEKGFPEKKLVYTMAWKRFTEGEYEAKVMMFREFPPDAKGVSYMGFFYMPHPSRNDDEWIYLPELRMVRKLSHSGPKHAKQEEFAPSELRQYDLMPRHPGYDTHQLLGAEKLGEVDCYVIQSTPKPNSAEAYPYSKVVKWISKDNFLPLRVEYYAEAQGRNEEGKLQKQQVTQWKKIGNAWVWEELKGINTLTGNKTTLTVSDVRINVGLTDGSFSKRAMQLGIEGVK
jgi:outer membrane lipoprotein-sorting protein